MYKKIKRQCPDLNRDIQKETGYLFWSIQDQRNTRLCDTGTRLIFFLYPKGLSPLVINKLQDPHSILQRKQESSKSSAFSPPDCATLASMKGEIKRVFIKF